MGDLTVIILAIGMIIICWVLVKINEKIDKHIKRFRKFEAALKKNSTGKIPHAEEKSTSGKIEVPIVHTSNMNRTQGVSLVAKKHT